MTETPSAQPARGPILLCAGTDAAAAGHLAEALVALLQPRSVVVLATWAPAPVTSSLDAVMDALWDPYDDQRDAARHIATHAAHAADDVLDAHGIHATCRICPEDESPWHMILRLADEIDAAVIVAPTSEGPGRRLGKQARALAHRSDRPLLLLPTGGRLPGDEAPAVFATDGSAPAVRATQLATALLRPRPALVASVWQPVSYAVGLALLAVPDEITHAGAEPVDDGARLRAAACASDGASTLTAAGWSGATIAVPARSGVAASVVATADERDAGVIVAGTRGHSRVAAMLLGSVAEDIVRGAGRPVLLVPPLPSAE